MHSIKDGVAALSFLMGGSATITIRSAKTGMRFTYKVSAPREDGKLQTEKPIRFVKILTGPDNNTNYEYIGYIRDSRFYYGGVKARVNLDSNGVRAFHYAFRFLAIERIPEKLEVFHEGKCGRCGRKLTTPSSIQSGFGAKCLERL